MPVLFIVIFDLMRIMISQGLHNLLQVQPFIKLKIKSVYNFNRSWVRARNTRKKSLGKDGHYDIYDISFNKSHSPNIRKVCSHHLNVKCHSLHSEEITGIQKKKQFPLKV